MRREPQLVHINGRLRAESRLWATGRITQEARRAAHDAARDWMARRCPGFFVANGEAQLLMDMLLMDKFDPIPGERTPREHSDALRALGITGFEHRTSPDVPHMLLCPVDGSLCRAFEGKRTWTLWGNREAIAGATEHLDMYGTDKNLAIALNANKRMANFLVMLAVSDFLAIMEAKYAVLRDSARAGHGSFKASGLRHLRESFLTLSLDLTSVERDVDTFWRRKWRDEGDAQFTLDLAPWIVESQKALGAKRFAPIDLNDELRNRQGEQFKTLIAADRDYREILSTVASLGASADAFRTGRVALWVALGSLGVALVTLLVTDVAGHTMLEGLISWLRSHIGF
jgi:hypothetical protein